MLHTEKNEQHIKRTEKNGLNDGKGCGEVEKYPFLGFIYIVFVAVAVILSIVFHSVICVKDIFKKDYIIQSRNFPLINSCSGINTKITSKKLIRRKHRTSNENQ